MQLDSGTEVPSREQPVLARQRMPANANVPRATPQEKTVLLKSSKEHSRGNVEDVMSPSRLGKDS